MGQPVFECRELIEQHHIQVFSSNYPLYADMSDRVMQTLATFSPRVEVYSIDEAFLDLSHVPREQLHAYGHQIRETVWRFTGIPVSVGIASTKTLTKVANEVVKKNPVYQGVLSLMHTSVEELDELLETLPVEDVWGIGPRYTRLLQSRDILTAKDLKYAEQRLDPQASHGGRGTDRAGATRHRLYPSGNPGQTEERHHDSQILRQIGRIPGGTGRSGCHVHRTSRREVTQAGVCRFQYRHLSTHQCVSERCAAVWQQPHTGAALSHFLYAGSVQRRAGYAETHLSQGVRVQEMWCVSFQNRIPGCATSRSLWRVFAGARI